jgi:hypothetical protein
MNGSNGIDDSAGGGDLSCRPVFLGFFIIYLVVFIMYEVAEDTDADTPSKTKNEWVRGMKE